jgi:hypothetical protein
MFTTLTSSNDASIQDIRLDAPAFSPPVSGTTASEPINITFQPATPSLPESLKKLEALETLAPNWDSYGGVAPTSEAIRMASRFLAITYDYLSRRTTKPAQPHRIAALPDGGIHLNWRHPSAEIDVEFSPEGSLSFLYVEMENGEDTSSLEEEAAPWWKPLGLIETIVLRQGQ